MPFLVIPHACSAFLKYALSIFNELVIKDDPAKKQHYFRVYMEGVQLPQDQVLGLEDRIFTARFLVNFIVTANLIFQ